ncbi:hypothetical protein [Saccharopolyspora phatthalungensis]|uniref:Integrase n=1 Tax=Saccharopolyspora phatthalungensis TaxID=664693 RepID=A0A840Q6T6_9PSEU|nr:hypothetical protein [Saccharopolyspora phatthalungensis]MBB5152533.1 hypothetical protein [Saccharopolyspora phatthalungensis]
MQAWLEGLKGADSKPLADSTKRVVFDHVSSILAAAVDDEIIGRNPCKSKAVKPPKRTREPIVPWTHAQVAAMRANIAERTGR